MYDAHIAHVPKGLEHNPYFYTSPDTIDGRNGAAYAFVLFSNMQPPADGAIDPKTYRWTDLYLRVRQGDVYFAYYHRLNTMNNAFDYAIEKIMSSTIVDEAAIHYPKDWNKEPQNSWSDELLLLFTLKEGIDLMDGVTTLLAI